MDPANVSPFVVWLGSGDCDVTGRAFEMAGGDVCVMNGWTRGPSVDEGRRLEPAEVGGVLRGLVAEAPGPGSRPRNLTGRQIPGNSASVDSQ